MRRPLSALFALLLCAAASLPAARAATDARTMYAQAVEADDHVSYSGTLTSVVYDGGDSAASVVTRIEHKAPRSWRIWYLAPADAYGRMIVSNESLTYQYEPSHNRIISHEWSSDAPAIAEPVNVPRVLSNYSVESGPSGSIAGRNAMSLSLVSKYTGALVQRMWIDESSKLILRRESYAADGSVISKSAFDSIRIGVHLPDDLFKLDVPAGMTVTTGAGYGKSTTDTHSLLRQANFTFAPPKYLPNGFVLERGSLETKNGVNTVEFVYGDGLRTFSLFENATGKLPKFEQSTPKAIAVGDATGAYAPIAGETLVSWNSGGLNFTIVGDLSSKEIARIGASIHP